MQIEQVVTAPKQKTEIFFPFVPHTSIPQIPSVVDVLFVLGLSEEEMYYTLGERHFPSYVNNVHFVVGITSFEVKAVWTQDAEQARNIIATTIISLCPESARCFFNSTFVEAKIAVGDSVPDRNASIDERRRACLCTECAETVRDQSATD